MANKCQQSPAGEFVMFASDDGEVVWSAAFEQNAAPSGNHRQPYPDPGQLHSTLKAIYEEART